MQGFCCEIELELPIILSRSVPWSLDIRTYLVREPHQIRSLLEYFNKTFHQTSNVPGKSSAYIFPLWFRYRFLDPPQGGGDRTAALRSAAVRPPAVRSCRILFENVREAQMHAVRIISLAMHPYILALWRASGSG